MDKKNLLIYNILNWHYNNNITFIFPFNELITSNKKSKLDINLSKNEQDVSISKSTIVSNKVNASTLKDLENKLENFEGCALKKTASNLVFSDGNNKSKVMLLGEAPGEEEDKTGKPFKGQAGMLLDKMLNAIGQNRNNTYISNIIFWRPPGNRNPTEEEIEICLPFVLRHIELVNPKILILAGAIAAKTILKQNKGIIQLRGNWFDLKISETVNIKTMPIFHPAFLLRQPIRKREAWEDLKKIKTEIDLIT